ncbi:exopolysaccharide biosynthesis protein [Phenylobacterium sp.]|uniref:exopolysaccharide biosynthesis protein n=1 Tax=Phenylobacterium sp. TaxID=1871053 RepID=UPI00272F5406|nr:exopolysaccharide biosynthesis protein [Phenylobacterium sp.]MDP1873555.1 exopolysaccharide biosynthesis protein [Phenylobacterium sp.]MDP3299531.1 exopolysaccharide biosynthesis protein [Phenylobacterium sp.]MDP3488556.1 exopolysaccharide biosynthesis protein [Phenylobacterium sp.]
MSLSEILRDLCDQTHEAEDFGALIARFGPRAFGALLFLFAAPNLLPLPPGSSTFLGAPLLLFAPQLALGVASPWMPARLRRQRLDMGPLRGAFLKLVPWVEQVELISSARLTFLFGPVGDRLIGLACTILAFVLMLPLPLGNLLPAVAISLFALALVQRDGVLALAGYVVTAISLGVLALAAGVIHRLFVAAVSGF